ncbi:MAG: hypothetical protein N2039_15590 [Gemmataceae bacterium]|nr:hypothetical protein [Gemmataceae bacterium]
MPIVCCNVAALTIALIYYAWRERFVESVRRRRQLHERVAYMLWCAANQAA